MEKHNFKKLVIWQKAMDMTDMIFQYVQTLPSSERFNLASQMNRCSCSIPSNIAEGSGKRTDRHFSEFLSTALTSSYELETQLLICERRKYGNPDLREQVMQALDPLQRMIFNFRERIIEQ